MNRSQSVFFVLVNLLASLFALQIMASDFQSPRTAALGGAGHAAPRFTDALYLNPAFVSITPVRSLSLSYLLLQNETSPASGMNWNASVVDGSTDSLFQAGIGFTRRQDVKLVHFSASKQIGTSVGVGLAGKLIFPNGPASPELASYSANYKDASLSATVRLTPWARTSLLIDNLFESAKVYGFLREYTLGAKVELQHLILLYLDPHWVPSLDSDNWGYEGGAELSFYRDLFLRAGSFRNSNLPSFAPRRGSGWGIGLGWLGPRLSIDYAYQRVNAPLIAHLHHVGISIYF